MNGFLILLIGMSLGFGFGLFWAGMMGGNHDICEEDEHGQS